MSIRIDAVDAGYLPGQCALGATQHPSCREPLKTAWHLLDENERERLTHSSSQSLRDRHLISEPSPGRGVKALIIPPSYPATGYQSAATCWYASLATDSVRSVSSSMAALTTRITVPPCRIAKISPDTVTFPSAVVKTAVTRMAAS